MAQYTSEIFVTVDAVVFGYSRAEGISLLLIKRNSEPFKGQWALPGGFIKKDESLETAVERELAEEAGIKVSYLEQLYTFGKPDRDPRGRMVSVAYFGLVRPADFTLSAATDADEAQWFPLSKLPTLAFDHAEIIAKAHARLQNKVRYEPIGFELLEPQFPFSDLEHLYTSLLAREIDRRNFKKKVLSLGVIEQLPQKVNRGSVRPAHLFRFNKQVYDQLKATGANFEI